MNKKIAFILILMFSVLFFLNSVCAQETSPDNVTSVDADENIVFQNDSAVLAVDDGYASGDFKPLESGVKNQTELACQNNPSYGSCSVILKDSDSDKVLANKNITISLDNTNYNVKTNNKGVASIILPLNPGNYALKASFSGDDVFQASNLSVSFKIAPTIQSKDVSKYYRGNEKYTARFLDIYGNPLNGKKVTVTVNGKKYSKKTNKNGYVSLAVNLKPGNYKIVSTNPSTKYQLTTNFKILSTITASNLIKVKGDNNKFTVKFLKSNGKALAKQIVKFKISGKTYKYKTDSKGQVKLAMNSFKAGSYKVVCYGKDGLSKTKTVTILKIAKTKLSTGFYNFLSNESKQVKVSLTTDLGGNSNSGKIIKMRIGSSTLSAKTDKTGTAYFKLPNLYKGLYDVEYQFEAKFFKKSKVRNFVTILDSTEPSIDVVGYTDFGCGAGTPFEIALTAGDVPLAKRAVTFTVNNNQYNVKTDNYGIASLAINLAVGNYTVDYKTYDEQKVTGTSGSCPITVFERTPTKLQWLGKTSFKDSSQSFKFKLTDVNGTPIPDQMIRLTIGDETYVEFTSQNGEVTFKTSVCLGKYKVVAEFPNSNDYVASSASNQVSVELSKFGKGLNVKTSDSYSKDYLKKSWHCQVNDAKIKSLVASLTKGLKTKLDKAKAIFNYVRDNIEYSYYYNSYYGATGTLKSKIGNCVDQAHLLIAMYRTAGFKARYVHGFCTFSDGRFGHVWTQVLVAGTWLCGDPTDSENQLGKINNWNTNTYTLKNRYISLPF